MRYVKWGLICIGVGFAPRWVKRSGFNDIVLCIYGLILYESEIWMDRMSVKVWGWSPQVQ